MIALSLREYALRCTCVFEAADVAAIAKAATLLTLAAEIVGREWSESEGLAAYSVAQKARAMADRLVGGDAEEKTAAWFEEEAGRQYTAGIKIAQETIQELCDEDRLITHLMDLRGEARVMLREAATRTNPDARDVLEGAAASQMEVARALHRVLQRLGVKGIGELDY